MDGPSVIAQPFRTVVDPGRIFDDQVPAKIQRIKEKEYKQKPTKELNKSQDEGAKATPTGF